jgi:GNAT superfamily N-acetyltransferase
MPSERVVIRTMDRPGDLGWVVMAHGELYAGEYGWDATFEASVAKIIADYGSGHDAEREAAWIADADGTRAGCVGVVAENESTARLRVLLVHPDARGHGIGGELVATAVGFARAVGYERMVLWTNDVLHAAIHLYIRTGFTLISEEPHHSYGADLVGQTYQLNLR